LPSQRKDLIGSHGAPGPPPQARDHAIATPNSRLVNAPELDRIILHDELDLSIGPQAKPFSELGGDRYLPLGGHSHDSSYVLLVRVRRSSRHEQDARGLERSQVPDASIIIRIVQQVGGSLGTAVLAVILTSTLTAATSPAALEGAFRQSFWWTLGFTAVGILISLALPGTVPAAVPTVAPEPGIRRSARTPTP
jgi:hypothetical protein